MDILTVKNLKRFFGSVRAVNDISLSLAEGMCSGLIGANGCGKTTLLRMLATLDLPDSGSISMYGDDIIKNPERVRSKIGWMPDYIDPWPNCTAKDYLDYFARAYGYVGNERLKVVDKWSSFTGITRYNKRSMKGLSKGELQRVSMARMLVGNPQILLMDEPAAGLDPEARIEFKQLVRALQDEGRTLLISSHILSELAEMCDHMIMMDRGRLLYSGVPEEMLNRVQEKAGHQGIRMRLRPLGELSTLKSYLDTRENWVEPTEEKNQLLASFTGDDAALAQELTAIMTAQPLLECSRVELNWEQGFIALRGNPGLPPVPSTAPISTPSTPSTDEKP